MEPDLKPIEGVSVMGLGRIGMCMAAGFAARGFPTIGVDVQPEVVRSANAGRPTFFEPGLEDALRSGGLRATEDLTEAVRRAFPPCGIHRDQPETPGGGCGPLLQGPARGGTVDLGGQGCDSLDQALLPGVPRQRR